MARSVWKGPFVELSLLKKAETAQEGNSRAPMKTWAGRPPILPALRGRERSVRRAVAAEEGRDGAGGQQPCADQDLVAPLNDPAAVRRPHLQRLQRPQIHPRVRQRGHR